MPFPPIGRRPRCGIFKTDTIHSCVYSSNYQARVFNQDGLRSNPIKHQGIAMVRVLSKMLPRIDRPYTNQAIKVCESIDCTGIFGPFASNKWAL